MIDKYIRGGVDDYPVQIHGTPVMTLTLKHLTLDVLPVVEPSVIFHEVSVRRINDCKPVVWQRHETCPVIIVS